MMQIRSLPFKVRIAFVALVYAAPILLLTLARRMPAAQTVLASAIVYCMFLVLVWLSNRTRDEHESADDV